MGGSRLLWDSEAGVRGPCSDSAAGRWGLAPREGFQAQRSHSGEGSRL